MVASRNMHDCVRGLTGEDASAGGERVGDTRAPQRRSTRLPFNAEVRASELNSGIEIWGATTNLSKGGCYVRTRRPFPQGTLVVIEIRNHGVRFLTDARVVYALDCEGMGLSFLNVPANQLSVLEDWLTSLGGEQPMQALRRETE